MSMSSAMQVDEAEAVEWQATGTEGAPNLQQVAAERLAAHRNRRAEVAAQEAEIDARTRQLRESARKAQRDDQRRGASLVRDAVQARYAQRESYREFLAAEAERAIQQAEAEAEVAARSARAVAEAQMQLLQEFDRQQPEASPRERALAQVEAETRGELAHALADIVLGAEELIAEPPLLTVVEAPVARPQRAVFEDPAVREISAAGLTVRLFEDIPATRVALTGTSEVRGTGRSGSSISFAESTLDEDLDALEEEIAFRRAPEFPMASVLETQAIPGNLIEFPRELVAPRRARPRLAEGPLREEAEPQLRIFEVDAEQHAQEPDIEDLQVVPDWQRMFLEGPQMERRMPPAEAQAQITLPPQTASLERRLMSAAVDGSIILAGWLCCVSVVTEICGPGLRDLGLASAAASGLGSLGLFAVMYQLLFFSLADSTPGMRWARIGLCTFGDGNPTRKAMRRRIFSTLLAACPLGLGLVWVWMDNDGMGWHDRMSRIYQRAY